MDVGKTEEFARRSGLEDVNRECVSPMRAWKLHALDSHKQAEASDPAPQASTPMCESKPEVKPARDNKVMVVNFTPVNNALSSKSVAKKAWRILGSPRIEARALRWTSWKI